MKNKYKMYIVVILFAFKQLAIAQTKDQVFETQTIPFELTAHNNISIKAVLNKKDTVKLMFHTAANDVTLTSEAVKSLSRINWDTKDEVKSWGGNASARFSAINTLEISNLKFEKIGIWENENSGPTTDGKFGPNLFTEKVIEIDFDKSVMFIHSKLPPKAKEYVKVPLTYENDFMFIEGISKVNGENYRNRFLIHSGYGGSVLYDDKFVAESKIGEQIEITEEKELKDSYGNKLKTKKGKLPQFLIGGEIFKDMPVGFFEGTIGRQQMSVLGGDILKRFNIILDSKREFIYLKPNRFTHTPYSKI